MKYDKLFSEFVGYCHARFGEMPKGDISIDSLYRDFALSYCDKVSDRVKSHLHSIIDEMSD